MTNSTQSLFILAGFCFVTDTDVHASQVIDGLIICRTVFLCVQIRMILSMHRLLLFKKTPCQVIGCLQVEHSLISVRFVYLNWRLGRGRKCLHVPGTQSLRALAGEHGGKKIWIPTPSDAIDLADLPPPNNCSLWPASNNVTSCITLVAMIL